MGYSYVLEKSKKESLSILEDMSVDGGRRKRERSYILFILILFYFYFNYNILIKNVLQYRHFSNSCLAMTWKRKDISSSTEQIILLFNILTTVHEEQFR